MPIFKTLLRLLPLLFLFSVGCSRAPEKPHIVFVVLDTVRRDVTGLSDRPAPWSELRHSLTPNFDRLAGESVAFTNAWSVAPWTVPSHASMFTGLLPSQHLCTFKHTRLFPTHPTFADILFEDGYETAAFFSNPWLADRTTGLLRGFTAKREAAVGSLSQLTSRAGDQGGLQIMRNVDNWLKERDGRKPALIFVNYLEAHLPYDPPASYRNRYLNQPERNARVSIEWGHQYNAGLHNPGEADWARIRRLYGADVWSADVFLGQLRDSLIEAGIWDNAYVIVVSDHGENLGEAGMFEHQFSLRETLLAVPLLLKYPEGMTPPARRDDPVMLTDLFGTVLEAAEQSLETLPPHSRSLLGEPAAADRPLIAQYSGPSQGLLGLLQGLNPELDVSRLKLALSGIRQENLRLTVEGDNTMILNDMSRDPGQRLDISGEFPDDVKRLKALLDVLADAQMLQELEDVEMDEATRKQLESLGYVAK
jgi:arylsulfatase A-like enzyme